MINHEVLTKPVDWWGRRFGRSDFGPIKRRCHLLGDEGHVGGPAYKAHLTESVHTLLRHFLAPRCY